MAKKREIAKRKIEIVDQLDKTRVSRAREASMPTYSFPLKNLLLDTLGKRPKAGFLIAALTSLALTLSLRKFIGSKKKSRSLKKSAKRLLVKSSLVFLKPIALAWIANSTKNYLLSRMRDEDKKASLENNAS